MLTRSPRKKPLPLQPRSARTLGEVRPIHCRFCRSIAVSLPFAAPRAGNPSAPPAAAPPAVGARLSPFQNLDLFDQLARRAGQARMPAGGYGLFQRGECRGLQEGGDRTADRHGPPAASFAIGRALRRSAGSAGRSNAGRGHGASAEDAGRPAALRLAQADPGAGVLNHQIGAGIPSIFATRPQSRAANGASSPWPRTSSGYSPSPSLTRLRCADSADRPQQTRYPALQSPSAPDSNPRRAPTCQNHSRRSTAIPTPHVATVFLSLLKP